MEFPGSTTISIDEINGNGDDDENEDGAFLWVYRYHVLSDGTYAKSFQESSSNACNSTLQQYRDHSVDSLLPELSIAYHADCILANTTETIKANMASAGVVLGLMPSLLSSLGPSLVVSTTLALERPFLSFLLAIAAPAFYPFRAFDYQDPLGPLKQATATMPRITPLPRWAHILISLLQYLLALAAASNVIITSLNLGLKTVVTWKKDQCYLPLMWVALHLAIHLCAMIRLHSFGEKVRTLPWNMIILAPSRLSDTNQQQASPKSPSKATYSTAIRLITAKTRLCALREGHDFSSGNETCLAAVLGVVLSVFSVVHLFMGTMIFSSLLFIGVNDAWRIVLCYSLPAAVAQLIRTFEIAGLLHAGVSTGRVDRD
ncbi:hypothetical protein EPUS_05062 [Endocarpon pusillum Z07020]|uniref:Uncharacterized protein n=1 Tax=Endocarpon pusillum (strain Z07020 / HMAS-L-300199) TaxID=1263415 RepID=U1GM47_ENDPU|nr:uncharacterized protein EPUS_05062 [Endocarpon pusillum Z07020]ERF72981.1 hypothetical protein EPUS_05062 [Endocarpon pusillum Z07020]